MAKHGLKIEPLPSGILLRQIYVDFLGYLLQHTQQYFQEQVADGTNIWEIYKPTMDVIIAHPNGWGVREQMFLRTAAIDAGFTSRESSVYFMIEAEASAHFCAYYTTLGIQMKLGDGFVVCDAGGLVVNTTVYAVKQTLPTIQLEEKCDSACVQAGTIYVAASAEGYLTHVFHRAGLDEEDVQDYTSRGLEHFQETVLFAFCESSINRSIQVAQPWFTNTAIGIQRGRMTLLGTTIESFFEGCVDEIISSVNLQVVLAAVPVP